MTEPPVPPEQQPTAGIPPPPAPASSEPPRRPPDLSLLAAGWNRAAPLGALAFVLVGLVGQVLAFLIYAVATTGSDPASLGIVNTLRLGAFYFFGFHHVGLSASGGAAAAEFQGRFTFELSVAMLAVTWLAAYLLYRYGRTVAESVGGSAWARALHGAKVGVPYALLSLILSYVIPFSVPTGDTSGVTSVDIGVAHLGAFFFPLLLGLVAGGLGGLFSARSDVETRGAWAKRGIAAVVAGWRMFLAALLFSFIGLLVLAAVKPDDTRAYIDGVTNGVDGADVLVQHLLFLPNQSMWVLVPAMGGCDGVYASGNFGGKFDFLCYTHFPESGGTTEIAGVGNLLGTVGAPEIPIGFGTAPPGYFLFLLVPLAAALLGGSVAARRDDARTGREGLVAGALAGVVFGALVGLGAWLSGIGVSVAGGALGFAASVGGTIGPRIWIGLVLGLAWGIVVGGLGGWIAGARRSGPRSEEGPAAAEPSFQSS